VEALIWTQSNGDLEEHAGTDVRQEEHLSALSAFDGFFGAWEITHGKPPTAPSNPHSRKQEDAFQGRSSSVSGEIRGMSVSMGTASTCLGFQSGVRDFRREAGAWNMVIVFTSNVQLAGFVFIVGTIQNDRQVKV
jgi:hypothetical protein